MDGQRQDGGKSQIYSGNLFFSASRSRWIQAPEIKIHTMYDQVKVVHNNNSKTIAFMYNRSRRQL